MSRVNKVNKTNYVQGGRLTPDEMARERQRQTVAHKTASDRRGRAIGKERIKGKAGEQGASRPRSAPEE